MGCPVNSMSTNPTDTGCMCNNGHVTSANSTVTTTVPCNGTSSVQLQCVRDILTFALLLYMYIFRLVNSCQEGIGDPTLFCPYVLLHAWGAVYP